MLVGNTKPGIPQWDPTWGADGEIWTNSHTLWVLVVFEVTPGRDVHHAGSCCHGKQVEDGRWSPAPWAMHRTSWKKSSALAQVCHVALSKSLGQRSCFPGSLEVPVWALAHTQFQCLVLLSVLSLWGGGYNKLLPVLRCRGADYTGALGTPVPGTTEDCFPGTSWGEPAKSWRHPAFAIRCLWFNKDSWGILYLFLSWKRLMKAIFLSLAKIFLWQLSSFH